MVFGGGEVSDVLEMERMGEVASVFWGKGRGQACRAKTDHALQLSGNVLNNPGIQW